MSRIIRTAPGLGRGGLLGNTEGPEAYLRALDTLPSQFCRATGGTETVISQSGRYYRVHTYTDTDPTSLLLNFDGSNGSTTFTDDSGWGHTVTANGNAAISTTQSKFGGASLALDGNSGTYLSLASNSAFTFGTEPFTVEAWVYPISTQQVDSIVSVGTTSLASNWQFYFWDTSSSQTRITWQTDAGTIITSSGYIQMNEWSHVAAVGNGSEVKLFINGQQDGTLSLLYDLSDAAVLRIGLNRGNTRFWPGYIDSLRITKGQALYTSAFTPSATALTRVGSGSLTFTRGGAVEYLVVGGGGGGGDLYAGGGGAGQVAVGSSVVTSTASVQVGAGGAGGTANTERGQSGSSSSFGSVSAVGGGGGAGGASATAADLIGSNGGSGGGAGAGLTGSTGGSSTASLGSDGGDSFSISVGDGTGRASGGGGGATSAGGDAASNDPGDGGDGYESSISGTATTYGGGGGGGARNVTVGGTGGTGGGGDGGGSSTAPTDGGSNTGGGGGGGAFNDVAGNDGGDGGSGIVIARYQITQAEYEAEAA